MKLILKGVSKLSNGVWLGDIDVVEIRELSALGGRKSPQVCAKSVVGLNNPVFDEQSKTIEVSISDFFPLAVGKTNEAILIDQSSHDEEEVAIEAKNPESNFNNFIEASRRENLPENLIENMHKLLNQIAKKYVFTLSEGKSRKWTAAPNFLAISIQNTKKRFLISVKGNHKNMTYKSIVPKRGMADSYSEIHFSSADQLPEVQDAIKNSARIQFGH
ncbi:hypothetical protein [Ruegeria atlantica]|uniref:hypothetical protein n=1 Tax=Ruegeria atlantica TaxID=81569 RepID=UPI00147CA280|nr:hypothetical protein [Ruegeria atlantica]